MQQHEDIMALAKTITWREITSWRKYIYYVRAKNDLRLSTSLTRREAKDILLYAQSTPGAPDRFDCAICGQSYDKSVATLEHIVPQTGFGSLNITNQVLTCLDCNSAKNWKYTLAGARDVLKGEGKEVNEAVANDAVRRAKRVVDLFMNFEYVDEYYIEPMERRREANRRKFEELLGLSEDTRAWNELLGLSGDFRRIAGFIPPSDDFRGIAELMRPSDDFRRIAGLVPASDDFRNIVGTLGQSQDLRRVAGLLEPPMQDLRRVAGLLEPPMQDLRRVAGLLEPPMQDLRRVAGLLEPPMQDLRRMAGLIGPAALHTQLLESQLRDSLLRQSDVFEEFDNLSVRLINALNVAIDTKSAEADSTPGNKL